MIPHLGIDYNVYKIANFINKNEDHQVIKEDLHLRAYRITTEPRLTNDHKKSRVSFAYWVQKSLRK